MVNPQRNRKIHTRNTRFLIISAAEAEHLEFIDTEPEEGARPHDNTGVDHEDLQEHHLQVALDAAQKSAATGARFKKTFIPTPDASTKIKNYEELYQAKWKDPSSLIRFSATVEESIGCSYCMDDEDEIWLKKFNSSRKSKDGPLSELSFEKIMSNFEDTTNERQPYLSTDPTVIAPFEEFEPTFEYLSLKALLPYAQHVYQHWKERRIKRMGKPIAPSLKFEENEKDDSNDPYICFRRREVRQVRKTRRQDAVTSERIRRLRAEMQQARDLVAMVSTREKCREETLKSDRALFLMRNKVKEVKRKLAIVGGDEDLVPLKKKKPVPEQSAINVRNALRPDGSLAGPLTMVSLNDYRRKRRQATLAQIESRAARKLQHNLGWSDKTEEEYVGILSDALRWFRNLTVVESPTDTETDVESVFSRANSISSVSSTESTQSCSRYRQRYGRDGRVYFDRAFNPDELEDEKPRLQEVSLNELVEDRMKFDPRATEDEKPLSLNHISVPQISFRARLYPQPERPRLPNPVGAIRVTSGNMSSPQMIRPPQPISSPSVSRPSLPFQTPK